HGVAIERALKAITLNPAKVLKLHNKGTIARGKDADILLLDHDLTLVDVIAKGKILMSNYEIIIKGTFES
ncbi:MAG: amidohydrolase family protein, partial [Pseudothermotoga sp.]